MPWFKVDDTLAYHRKAMAAGNAAMGLWVRAGSYCAQQLTDGYVSHEVLATLGTRSQAARLVSAGLWDAAPGGFRFHDWQDYQPTRAEVHEARTRERDKKRRWRERAGRGTNGQYVSTGDSAGDNPVSSPGDSPRDDTGDSPGESTRTRPDPTRPSSPLTPRSHAARVLGWQEEDERLDALPALLKANNVKSPAAWINRCHLSGDLEYLLTHTDDPGDDGWSHLPHTPEPPRDPA